MSKRSATTLIWQIIMTGAFALGGSVGFAQTDTPPDVATLPDQSAPVKENSYEAVVSYLDSATKDGELAEIMAKYGSTKDDGSGKNFADSKKEQFKAAFEAARDQPDLAFAIKNVRAAQIAVWTRYSREARASLTKAIADANVELELVR